MKSHIMKAIQAFQPHLTAFLKSHHLPDRGFERLSMTSPILDPLTFQLTLRPAGLWSLDMNKMCPMYFWCVVLGVSTGHQLYGFHLRSYKHICDWKICNKFESTKKVIFSEVKMARFISGIFWLHLWIMGGSGDLSIFILLPIHRPQRSSGTDNWYTDGFSVNQLLKRSQQVTIPYGACGCVT